MEEAKNDSNRALHHLVNRLIDGAQEVHSLGRRRMAYRDCHERATREALEIYFNRI